MSFRPHWINPKLFLVRVNREAQKERREKSGSIFLDQNNTFMTRNMQYGEIVMIGANARTILSLPEAQEGDNLIFQHFIEGSTQAYNTEGQSELNNEYLLSQDDVFNYYQVPASLVYGIEKDGVIFPTTKHIFASFHKDEIEASESTSKGGLILIDNYRESEEDIQLKIDDIKATLQHTVNHEAQVKLTRDMEALSSRLNSFRFGKFHPLFVHNNFHRDCGRKITKEDVLYYVIKGAGNVKAKPYELEFKGTTYLILNADSVQMVSKDEPLRIEEINEVLFATSKGELQEQILK